MKDGKGHRIRYTQAVDWISFGWVVYEMIIGTFSEPSFSPSLPPWC